MLVIEVGGGSHDRQLVRVAVEGVTWPVRASIGGGGIVAHDVGASRCNGIVEASSRGVPHHQQVRAWKMLLPVVAVNLFRVSSVSAFHLFQRFTCFRCFTCFRR